MEANKQKADKGYLISLKDREGSDAEHWFCVWTVREGEVRCVPYGNPLASSQRHTAVRETVWEKRTTEVRYTSKDARKRVQGRGRTAHIERVYGSI